MEATTAMTKRTAKISINVKPFFIHYSAPSFSVGFPIKLWQYEYPLLSQYRAGSLEVFVPLMQAKFPVPHALLTVVLVQM